jgi:hypothetical protein
MTRPVRARAPHDAGGPWQSAKCVLRVREAQKIAGNVLLRSGLQHVIYRDTKSWRGARARTRAPSHHTSRIAKGQNHRTPSRYMAHTRIHIHPDLTPLPNTGKKIQRAAGLTPDPGPADSRSGAGHSCAGAHRAAGVARGSHLRVGGGVVWVGDLRQRERGRAGGTAAPARAREHARGEVP